MIDNAALLELLDTLEKELLEMEGNLDRGEDSTGSIHFIFQKAHNLKSGLSMVGMSQGTSLVHALEDLFDGLRRGRRAPHPSDIDFCMRCVDALRESLETGQETLGEYHRLLTEAQRSRLISGVAPSVPVLRYGLPLTAEESQACDEALAKGQSLWRVDKLVKKGLTPEQWNDLPILEDVRQAGAILRRHPEYSVYAAGRDEQVLQILFSTTLDAKALSLQVFDPLILQAAPPTTVAASPKESLKPMPPQGLPRVLVVDDDRFTAQIIVKKLEKRAICQHAEDGEEAWHSLKASLESGHPFHGVLLDLMLPRKTGREVLRDFRDLEAAQGIHGLDRAKVIIISALNDLENITGTFREQADGYLVKPFTMDKLLQQMVKSGILSGPNG